MGRKKCLLKIGVLENNILFETPKTSIAERLYHLKRVIKQKGKYE